MANTTTKKKKRYKLKAKYRLHIGYNTRLVIFTIFFAGLLISSCYFFGKSIFISEEQKINYTEKSKMDYSVSLKENDFYEESILNKNMSYIANLIDHINLNFKYDYEIDKEMNTDFIYAINAELRIVNPNTKEVYFTKKYDLLDSVRESSKDKKYSLNKSIDIDYDYYNDLANKFKSTYAVDTDSSLIVTLRVNRNITDDIVNANDLSNSSDISISIPLSQKAISIKMDYDDLNNHETIISNKTMGIKEKSDLVIAIILLLIAIYILISLTKIISNIRVKSSKYDVLLRRIKKDFDRLIVDVSTAPDLEKFNVTKIKEFEELLDLHDNYAEPIRFIEITKHVKSYFYIQRENELFLFVLKEADLDD